MSWLSEFLGGGSNPNVRIPTQAEINAILVGQSTQELATDPVAYHATYGNLTPQEVADGGYRLTNPSEWTDVQKQKIESSRVQPAGVTETAAAPAPAPDTGPIGYTGPTARQKLDELLPSGFEQSVLGSGLVSPFVESAFNKERGTAQDFINNALSRGTLTDVGGQRALSALGTQDPTVRSRLQSVGDALLENERGKLTGLANVGREAANTQSGEFFDPTPYKRNVDQELAAFTAGLPGAYSSAAPSGLYDTGGLLSGGGAVQGPQNVSYDPYAQEGGKLSTGLDDSAEASAPRPEKKRRTSVF